MSDLYNYSKKKDEQTMIETDTGKRKKEQFVEKNLKTRHDLISEGLGSASLLPIKLVSWMLSSGVEITRIV